MIPIDEIMCRRDYSAPISDRAIIAEIDFYFQLWSLALHVEQLEARWDEIPGQDLVWNHVCQTTDQSWITRSLWYPSCFAARFIL